MKERLSLIIGWPFTGAQPTPKRPTDDTCERRLVADKRTLAGHRRSHFGLLSHFESIVYLDPEVSHGAFDFCMAQE